MNALEQRLADRFRENGDHLFSGLPDWPNTVVEVGDPPLRITANRLPDDLRYPPVYRHHVRVPFDSLAAYRISSGTRYWATPCSSMPSCWPIATPTDPSSE